MCVLVNGHVYVCVRGIEFASFYDFNILFCNCSDSFSFVCVFVLIIYDSIEYTSRDDICPVLFIFYFYFFILFLSFIYSFLLFFAFKGFFRQFCVSFHQTILILYLEITNYRRILSQNFIIVYTKKKRTLYFTCLMCQDGKQTLLSS